MAKKGRFGHPGSSGLAQSGGINQTFGGGKGGTAASKKATHDGKRGTTRLNNGLDATIRNEPGDNARVKQTGLIGKPPPIRGGDSTKRPTKIVIRRPVRGGDR